jgi:LAO/AO transport system kinase
MAKAGILEIADVFVVNKGDRDGVAQVQRELRQMLQLGAARPWDPPVLGTTATTDEGLDELWLAIARHRAHLDATGSLRVRRHARVLQEVEALAAERFRQATVRALAADGDLAERLRARTIDPYAAADALLRRTATDG